MRVFKATASYFIKGEPVASSVSPGSEMGSDDSLALTEAEVVEALQKGKLEEQGLMPYSSNTSFLVFVRHQALTLPAVYKPQRGENPLWDFEWGTLCRRETAAYVISCALGWGLVPPTVLRSGTRGLGSVQFYVDHDADMHYFTVQADARFAQSLRQLTLFDFLINNADRKSGHCLIDDQQRLWAIDHGICFHTEYKLRTVIWEFSGEPLEEALLADLVALRQQVTDRTSPLLQQLCALLSEAEIAALLARLTLLIRSQEYPSPQAHRRNYPWPPV
jgi:uncharacterized repeat protein (TIGR03843 family)